MRRSSWIFQVGPNSNGMCPYKNEAVRDLTQRGRDREHRGRNWRSAGQVKECWQPPQLEKARNQFSPGAFGRSMALPTP